jgi:hypothetical protein
MIHFARRTRRRSAQERDPNYLADAHKQHLESAFMTGAEIETLIGHIFASPPAVIARAQQAIEAGKGITTPKQ